MKCPHRPQCPGCSLAEHPYEDQLETKRRRLQYALDRYPHLGLGKVKPVIPATRQTGYRHRLKLPLHITPKHVSIGLYDRKSGRVLDTPDCPVLADGLREGLPAILEWLKGKRGVHSLDLRWTDAKHELQAVIACDGASLPGGRRGLKSLMKRLPNLTSVAVSMADPQRKRVMGRKPRLAAGEPYVEEAIGNTHYRLHPGAFFQTDPQNAKQIHDLVKHWVGDAQTVMDLYAGVGAYALMLAPGRKRVLAVEEVPQAARAAAEMGGKNLEVISQRVEDVGLDEPVDVAVINPARRGSDPETLERLCTLANRIVYVSCGPETLARDLDVLAAHGMKVDDLRPIDLFPQTPEVETVVHLTKARPLTQWKSLSGTAASPWTNRPSGALGRPTEALVLVVGDPGRAGSLPGVRWRRLMTVAGHGLLHLHLDTDLRRALQSFAKRGYRTAGYDDRTARFFREKAGLQRPFVHVLRSNRGRAGLHGDLSAALKALGVSRKDCERLERGKLAPERPRRRQ